MRRPYRARHQWMQVFLSEMCLLCALGWGITVQGEAAWEEEAKLTASEPAANDFFGFSVVLFPDTEFRPPP